MSPINVTGYDRAERAERAELEPLTASEIIDARERHRAESQRRLDAALSTFIEPILDRLINLIHQRPGGHRTMKIHLVTIAATAESEPDKTFLVKAHTKAGAEKFVRGKFKPSVEARIPTQDELVAALKAGIEIEDATNSPQASIPEPAQAQE